MARKRAEPPKTLDLSSIVPHPGQLEIVQKVRDYPIVVHSPGRRWGKSSCRILVNVDRILRSNGFVEGACSAQSHAEATNLWEKDLLAFGSLVKDAKNEDQRRFIDLWPLSNAESRALGFDNRGARIWYPSMGQDHAMFQGHGLWWAIMDEMSLSGVGAWPDTIRPMLGDQGGHALLMGVPYPEGPNFAEYQGVWELGNPANHLPCGDPNCAEKHRDPKYVSSAGCSWDNPRLKPEGLKDLRAQYDEMCAKGDVARAKCLYYGMFCTDQGAVFSHLDTTFTIKPTVDKSFHAKGTRWWSRTATDGETIVIGLDFGEAEKGDATVASAISVEKRDQLEVLRFRGVEYEDQLPYIDSLYKRMGPRTIIVADGRSHGAHVVNVLRRKYHESVIVVPWTHSGPNAKTVDVMHGVHLCQATSRSNALSWRLMKIPEQEEEFRLYTKKPLPSGGYKYGAPSGHHDDFVCACLFASRRLPVYEQVTPALKDESVYDLSATPKGTIAHHEFLLETQRLLPGGSVYHLR